ncbi:MAG: TIR domain-containing protein [Lachnospiraceae bacterium]|nr:TIR domain-containing protein [Lachnospiraceae bacterium]
MTDKKYDAFISYRHTELDKFVAINLHKKLEAFKLPKGVTSSTGKKKIERVFRDQDELPLSSDLSAQINDALIVSDFLIVICTPRLPQSEWCKREIETFIKLHGRDKILAVLAEGEPWESFPEALTKEEVEVTKPDGTKVIELHNVEPLAADVRGKNNKEIKKKLDDAVLRIAAAIFCLGYDDLKQRHKERKMKRTISVVSGIAAGLLLFSAVCLAMTFKIMVQSEMILDQNNEIKEQSNRISLMAQELEIKNQDLTEQYRETHINYARATADNADELMHKGRKLDALYALRRVMPSTIDDESVPYTAETQLALTNALEVYYSDSSYSTGIIYEADSNITDYDVSSNDKYLATLDTPYTLRVYDIESGEILYSADVSTGSISLILSYGRYISFINDDTVLLNTDEGLTAVNITENTEENILNPDTNDILEAKITAFKDANIFCAFNGENIYIYNSDDLSLLYEYKMDDFSDTVDEIRFVNITPNSEYILLTFKGPEDNIEFFRIALSDGEIKYLNTLKPDIDVIDNYIDGIFVSDDSFYLSNTISDLKNLFVSDTNIVSFDLETGKMNWKTPIETPILMLHKNIDGNNLFAASSKKLYVFDSSSGEMIDSLYESAEICFLQKGSFNGDYVDYISTDGFLKSYMGYSSTWRFTFFDTVPDYKISSLYATENGVLVLPENNNYITYYHKRLSDNTDEAAPTAIINNYCQEINKTGDLCLCLPPGSQTAEIRSTITGDIAYEYTTNNDNLSFVNDGKSFIVAFGSGFKVYDFVSEKVVCAAPVDYYFDSDSISCDKQYILGKDHDEYTVFSLLTGEKVSTFKLDEDINPHTVELINKDTYAVVEIGKKLKFYKIGDSKPCYESSMSLSNKDFTFKCAYDDILCVSYENNSFEVYSADDSVKLLKSFYSMDYRFTKDSQMIYYPGKDVYVLSESNCDYTYVFNSEAELIAIIPEPTFFIEDINRFVFYGTASEYSAHFYSYEELIKMADDILGDYHPSLRITSQFNIK